MVSVKREEDIHILGFRDREKVDRVPSVTLSLVITTTILNYSVSGILVEDHRSSCDIMYHNIFRRLGLPVWDLTPYEGGSLMTFNESSTHPYGVVEILIYV